MTVRAAQPSGALPRRHTAAIAVAALLAIAAADVAIGVADPPFVVLGLLDEPAHAATAVLLLAVLPPHSWPWLVGFALGAVAIDIDHVALLFGSDALSAGTGRPYGHSLATLAVLLGIAFVGRGTTRRVASGAAVGLVVHFVRDLATGSGVALLWPASFEQFSIPYGAYAVGLVVLAVVAVHRSR